ncbi:hypothetical protein [Paraburkholderia sp. J67]|uniref:hypothetical protein n=1 Tax=Paraburkholderia sp. J67 TaxID=2805435 RepID=UPI002ABD36D8|nr:hypothetical protein [Paraburkholderia sp. J67]
MRPASPGSPIALTQAMTPAVCRKSYVHPCVIDAWRSRTLAALRVRRGKAALAPAERAFATLLAQGDQSAS